MILYLYLASAVFEIRYLTSRERTYIIVVVPARYRELYVRSFARCRASRYRIRIRYVPPYVAIIKPDIILAGKSGKIIDLIEQNGFEILRLQKGQLSKEMSEVFYDEHKEKPFFNELVDFIAPAPIIIMALQKENAIADWRKLMGATDPAASAPGTIRGDLGVEITENLIHGSDSSLSAERELSLFFEND